MSLKNQIADVEREDGSGYQIFAENGKVTFSCHESDPYEAGYIKLDLVQTLRLAKQLITAAVKIEEESA